MNKEPMRSGLGVGGKLWLGVLLLILALAAVVVQTSLQSRSITAESEAVLAQKSEKLQLATVWAGLVETNVTRVQATFISANPELETLYRELIPQTVRQINEVQTRLAELATSAPERELMQQIAAQRQTVLDSLAQARALREQGNAAGAMQEIAQRFNPGIAPYMSSLREFAALQATQLQQSQAVFA
ncbi:MAG: MCP four helix bundle domain-containing protein, partial [Serpentinimonas sp.]|nr:MCP four helix bundle domain-containing protein [Serpentinimonas sp.]